MVVVLKVRVLHRKWEITDCEKWNTNRSHAPHAEMTTRCAPFSWGLSFTAVPIPIKMPSCMVRILACEASSIVGKYDRAACPLTNESSSCSPRR